MSITETKEAKRYAAIAEVAAAQAKIYASEAINAPEYTETAKKYAEISQAAAGISSEYADSAISASEAASNSVIQAQIHANDAAQSAQEAAAAVTGTLRVPEADIPFLPDSSSRAGLSPAFDGAGNPIVYNAIGSDRLSISRSVSEIDKKLSDGSFEQGATLESKGDVLWYQSGGVVFYWDGAFPKTVPSLSTPESTGGIAAGAWVNVTDLTLRVGLGQIDGVSLIGGGTYAQIRAYNGTFNKIDCLGRENVFDGADGVFNLDLSDTTSADNGGTILVDVNGGRWKRQYSGSVNLRWFTSGTNDDTAYIKSALDIGHNLYVPSGEYSVTLSNLNVVSGQSIIGDGFDSVFIGPDEDKIAADADGVGINISGVSNVSIKNIHIKNGYKGKGLVIAGSQNVLIEDVAVTGFTQGLVVMENNGLGSKNINIVRPRIINTRYWGLYVRGLDIANKLNWTQNINISGGYFYNCNMAALVVSEGRLKDISISDCYFDRCPVDIHLETVDNVLISSIRTVNTGKYEDQLPTNNEYPFPTLSAAPQPGWSIYAYSVAGLTVSNCHFDAQITHYASNTGNVIDITYSAVTALVWYFTGAGDVVDENHYYFNRVKLVNCISDRSLIIQNESDVTGAYIRELIITNCVCLLGQYGETGNGTQISVSLSRVVNFVLSDSSFRNSAIRVKSDGAVIVTSNTFDSSDNTQNRFSGFASNTASDSTNTLVLKNNIFRNSGGVVIGESAVLINGFSCANLDNTIVNRGGVNYCYTLENCYLINYAPQHLANAATGLEYIRRDVNKLISWGSVVAAS
ncbi:hypothetical protein [Pectobacterium aroidearum]|uniref:tail fiber/spike domain-containing protein n=1 Tax=Pectobacterium aroidearum TaxID=1201031 RepID=UPI0030173311